MKLTKTVKSYSLSLATNCAAMWCFLFALLNIYWVLGGGIRNGTIGIELEKQRFSQEFMRLVFIAALLKVLCGVFALLLKNPASRYSQLKFGLAFTLGIAITAYGTYNLCYSLLMAISIFEIPVWLGEKAAWWHLFLWSPVWLSGGLLFLSAALCYKNIHVADLRNE